MAESDEVVKRARESRKKVDKAVVEFVEAFEHYIGNRRAQRWEEEAREWQGVEQKRPAMNDAWKEYGGFLEQHREHLKRVGWLK
jgi:hypothetical protein